MSGNILSTTKLYDRAKCIPCPLSPRLTDRSKHVAFCTKLMQNAIEPRDLGRAIFSTLIQAARSQYSTRAICFSVGCSWPDVISLVLVLVVSH